MYGKILHTQAVSKHKGAYILAALTAVLGVLIAPQLIAEVLR